MELAPLMAANHGVVARINGGCRYMTMWAMLLFYHFALTFCEARLMCVSICLSGYGCENVFTCVRPRTI